MTYRIIAASYLASYAVVNRSGWAEGWPGELTITGDRLYLGVFRQGFLCQPASMIVIYLLLKFFVRPGPSQSCPADPAHAVKRRLQPRLDLLHQPSLRLRPRARAATGGLEERVN
jgi:hypothetical protein